MIVRAIQESDMDKIKAIHKQFYKGEFPLPSFSKSLCVFVVEEDDKIICAVDLHPIIEATLITNKSVSPFKRKRALFEVLAACKFVTKQHRFNQLHAFVQEKIWKRALLKFGFRNTKGNALVINVE